MRKLSVILTVAALALGTMALTANAQGRGAYSETVTVNSNFYYPTVMGGQAADVLVTNTGYVLVSLSGPAGVQVFKPAGGGYINACGENIISLLPAVQSVYGIKFVPGPPQVGVGVGAAVEDQGAEFFSLPNLDTWTNLYPCFPNSVVAVPQPQPIPSDPGTFDLAVTPNGSYAFIANEDGLWSNGSGTIGIVKIQRDWTGRFTPATGPILVNGSMYYITVNGATTLPGLTVSHDGKRLYAVHEIAKQGYENPTNIPTNSSSYILVTGKTCVQKNPNDTAYNGLLTVIDVDNAIGGQGQNSILQTIASACSPTRVVETANGQYIFVAARGSDEVLAFDVQKLLYSPNDALVGWAYSGGTSPVGLALFDNDQFLAVANSNRFTDGAAGITNVAILDVRNPLAIKQALPPIPSENIYSFPRGVTLGPDGSSLYVANFGCTPSANTSCTTTTAFPGKLQVIRIRVE